MKKEVELYFVALLLVGILFLMAFFYTGITGFAVFEQSDSAGFNEGVYENTLYNGSAVILNSSANVTSGIYTSKIFDGGNDSVWNNLTWVGEGDLTFEVRACSSSDCTNKTFITADLNNLNLTSQYFQYKVYFNQTGNETLALESVFLDYSVIIVEEVEESLSVSISEPSGTKDSTISIPISFTTNKEITTCLYNVLDASDNALITNGNVTIPDCLNSTSFSGSGEGDFTFNLYVFNEDETAYDSSSFSISFPSPSNEETDSESDVQVPSTTVSESSQPTIPTYQLSAGGVQSLTLNPGESKQATFLVTNKGNLPVSACIFKSKGDQAEWVSFSGSPVNLNVGDQHSFSFDINVPEDAEAKSYTLSNSVECSQTSVSKSVSLEVVEITFKFDLINVRKIRSDEVRATYELSDLSGEDQTIDLTFVLFDNTSKKVSETTDTINLTANETDDFRTIIDINESIEGNLTIQVDANSEVYSSSVQEAITLGAPPILGFVIFENVGTTGGIAILVISIIVLLVLIFVVRRARKSKFFKGDSK